MATKHAENSKKRSYGIYIIIPCIIILAIAISMSTKGENTNNVKTTDDRLAGEWTTDGITVYKFDGKGNGSMKLPSGEYKYTYVLHDNKLYIDFESEKATDSDYEYSFDGDKLILKGIKSTTGTYTFTHK